MEARPDLDLHVDASPDGPTLLLPGDDEPLLKTFSLDHYAQEEAEHARCHPPPPPPFLGADLEHPYGRSWAGLPAFTQFQQELSTVDQ